MSRAERAPRLRLRPPKFKNEAEEAAWWDSHSDQILKEFERAYGRKAVERMLREKPAAAKRAPTRPITLRLPVADVARAQRLAARKGLGYQTLVKTLLREALDRAESA